MLNKLIRDEKSAGSIPLWGAWHALVCISLGIIAALTLSQSFTSLFRSNILQLFVLVGGYLAISLYIIPAANRSSRSLLANLILAATICFGGGYALLVVLRVPVSGWLLAIGSVAAVICAAIPYLTVMARNVAIVIVLIVASVVIAGAQRSNADGEKRGSVLHTIAIHTYADLIDPPAEKGGAIESLASGILLVTGDGIFYWITQNSPQDILHAETLPIPEPMDRKAFLTDFDNSKAAPRLMVTDALFDPTPQPRQLYVAHQVWNSSERCFTIRISVISLEWPPGTALSATSDWRTLFESRPCLQYAGPFDDFETGGRLAWAKDGGLLLTLGDHGFNGLNGDAPYAQRNDVDYGKILKVDAQSGAYRVVSVGHRNPQGLVVTRDGRIWESEHGPKGGDELNLIVDGQNYGWPNVTYGTNYGSSSWSLNPEGYNHGSFREPAIAFVPSIATTALIEINGKQFPRWNGDLLLGSLKYESLYRIRIRQSQVIYTEPIRLDRRVRDITQTTDGRIFVWSDSGIITELSRAPTDNAYTRFCSGCHEPKAGAAAGPTLHRVMGRKIASVAGYNYSAALKDLRGKWTEEALDAFLRDPNAYAPGTTMRLIGLDDPSRAEVVAYLMENAH